MDKSSLKISMYVNVTDLRRSFIGKAFKDKIIDENIRFSEVPEIKTSIFLLHMKYSEMQK